MPVLTLEPFLFPDNLFADRDDSDETCFRWWVLYTKPRAEKALARRFYSRRMAFFLPVYERRSQSRGRLLSSHLPVFPGYIFLYGDADARLRALETNQVARCLPVEDQHELHEDLACVYQLIMTGAPLAPEDRLVPGALVEIVNGPLAGFEGKILRRGGQLRLLVEVKFLQRGISVEIDNWAVRPLVTGGASAT